LPLTRLWVDRCGITDISVLPSTQLRNLWLGKTRVADLTPLARCRDLERLGIHGPRDDLGFLRTHPALKIIQYTQHVGSWSEVKQNAAQFWRAYDAAR